MEQGGFLYESIAGRLAGQINAGSLQPGDRVPSLRSLSRELGVSLSTAMQAYGLLEGQGLIEAVPQSGYYVRARLGSQVELIAPTTPAVEPVVPSNPLLHSFLRAVADEECVPLGCAAPSMDLLPVKRLGSCTARVLREHPEQAMDYSFPPGQPEFRRQIAARGMAWLGKVTPNQVVITSGGLDALNLALRAATRPGDTVAVESPTFFGLLQVLEHLGLRALELPTNPVSGIKVDALEAAAKRHRIRAALLIPVFSNPLGALMPDAAKRRTTELARRYDFHIIEDDIYGELQHQGRRPAPIKAFDEDDRVLYCSSFSKSLAPGLRIGWVVSQRFRERIEDLQFNSTIGSPTLAQLALAEYLASGAYEAHLRRLRPRLAANMLALSLAVTRHFPRGTRFTRPQGGYVLWIELPPKVDSLLLFRTALKARISIAPGPLFSTQERYGNFIRLNCGHAWNATIEAAVQKLGRLASAQC